MVERWRFGWRIGSNGIGRAAAEFVYRDGEDWSQCCIVGDQSDESVEQLI